jgi:hypothetical protein
MAAELSVDLPLAPSSVAHAAIMLATDGPGASTVARLRAAPDIDVFDHRESLRNELTKLRPPLSELELSEPGQWAYYPWRRAVVSVLGPRSFQRLRLDRNRNKITAAEQEQLGRLTIGVVGLSVGHAIAHTLALEGLCGRLRLADNDSIELTNLNRIPASILDIGVNKAITVARRIAELNPYLPVDVFPQGLTEESLAEFFTGLDLVIEECDSLDMKVRVRQVAKEHGIPVFMETSDRGLFDVERFDLEPDRELFHGLLGDIDPHVLQGLSNRDKAPHVMRILQTGDLSARMAASMVEIDRTVSTWPQLASDVQLGGATVAAAVRRFGRGEELRSGRIRVDLSDDLDRLGENEVITPVSGSPSVTDISVELPVDPREAVIQAIRLAPSGGNSQPWTIGASGSAVEIRLAADRTSAMDVEFRGSYVAIGAATFNARVAAAKNGVLGRMTEFPAAAGRPSRWPHWRRSTRPVPPPAAVSLALGSDADAELAALYPAMLARISNRHFGRRMPLDDAVAAELRAAAAAEGADLRLLTTPAELATIADIIAESDRIRFLTPHLHREMMGEIRWPGRDRMDLGIDVRTLGLDDTDLAKLEVASRADVMAQLASWEVGEALGDSTRDRVNSSSAIGVVTVSGSSAGDYLRGGMAMERVWIQAQRRELGVHPVSPVFLYAKTESELQHLSPRYWAELSKLQSRFDQVAGLRPADSAVLVLRISSGVPPALRSERLRREDVVSTASKRNDGSGR